MKKLFIVLMLVATASMGQGTLPANMWNLNWMIAGAVSPEGGDVLQDYSVTWQLLNASDSNSLIAEMSSVAPADSIGFTDERGTTLSYLAFLEPDSSVFKGATDIPTSQVQYVYQRIELYADSILQYFWEGEQTPVYTKVYDPNSISPPPTDLADVTTFVEANAWTKASDPTSVPEPATLSLLGLGALAMVVRRKVRK